MALNFPASPSNGQIYFDTTTGSEYVFNSGYASWIYSSGASPVSNSQVVFINQNLYAGSNGLVFNVTSNTLYTNTVNVSQNVTTRYFFGNEATVTGNIVIKKSSAVASLDVNGSVVIANTLEPIFGYQGLGLLVYNQQTIPIQNTTTAQYYIGSLTIPSAGQSNTGLLYVIGSEDAPTIASSNQSGRVILSGHEIYSYRTNANDISTFATNGVWGLYIEAGHQSTLNANASTGSVYAAQLVPENYRANVTSMYGVQVSGYSGSVAGANTNTTNFYSLYTTASVGASSGLGTDTVTNYYDAYLNGSTAAARGTITNKYGVYQVKTDHNNYFGGAVNFANANVVVSGSNVLASFAAANAWANVKVDTITSNSTSRIWANSVTVSGIETVYLDLANSGVTATTYGGSTQIPAIAVDAYGRITSASNVSFTGGSTVGNETTSGATYYPVFTTTTSGTMSVANVSTSGLTFIPSSGTLSATIFNSLSDFNYKTNITAINDSIQTLNELNPVAFNWKDTGEKSYGVIAQELEKVLPELVATHDGIKSVAYAPLIAILIDVVQKQQKEIEEIKKLLNTVIIRK